MTTSKNQAELDRLAPTKRPAEKPVGFQTWRDLFFLHWSVPKEILRAAIPSPLELDLYDDHAWLGIVPFKMREVHPAWFPAIPGISNFLETNVRTYVYYKGEPGVWFFSLDANATLATLVARLRWNLNYCCGRLTLAEQEDKFHFTGRRMWPKHIEKLPHYDIRTALAPGIKEYRTASPGSFEHFLVERYLLFTRTKSGKQLRGQVHHSPYTYTEVQEARYIGNLEGQIGLENLSLIPNHALYSPGVSVEMFSLREV
ncbi:MAG: DUF2071 domain-containing protein [Planctomycetaceae bacterium]|nr:DUF2071 domain-containing protein [Planctomycetaceae bacterium]